jgi:hypothetical protein
MCVLLKTFFYRKKVFKLSKNALAVIVGRCPTPCPPFEKGGAKTFMGGFAAGEYLQVFYKFKFSTSLKFL